MELPPSRAQHPVWAVAIAASAGGIPALVAVLSELTSALPAAVLVVQHIDPRRTGFHLVQILARRCALNVVEARQGMELEAGSVYVAPPDHHLVVTAETRVGLTCEPAVHFVRPAADVLFPTVAARFGAHSIAVVLTGSGSDGAAGAEAIHRAGGIVIAQNEATSQHFGMPGAAIAMGHADYILPIELIARQIVSLTAEHG